MNPVKIYEEATTPPNKEEELRKAQAEELARLKQEQLNETRQAWLSQQHTQNILQKLEGKELQLRQEAAVIVATGNGNNELLRAKIAESLALAKMAGLMHGVINDL